MNVNSSLASLSGNLDLAILGVFTIPVSFYLGTQNKSFNQPSFKQYGLSPKYKWFTLHLGYRNLCLSEYSLNGVTFFGAAAEISFLKNAGKFCLMGGQLRKSSLNTENSGVEQPGYERRGYGGSLELGNRQHKLGLAVFKSADIFHSPIYRDSVLVHPAANLVIAFNTEHTIKSFFQVSAAYTLSQVTDNTRSLEKNAKFPLKLPDYLIITNTSSSLAGVFALKAEGSLKSIRAGISYLHIDPGYRSFGCTFLNNDRENYLFNLSFPLLKGKLAFAAQLGMERNNLRDLSATNSRRLVGSANMNLTISGKLSAAVQYSNFSITSKPSYLRITDSLICIQTSGNIGLNLNFTNRSYSICLNSNLQDGDNLNYSGTARMNSKSRIGFAAITGNVNIPGFRQRITGAFNYNSFQISGSESSSFGPSISINQDLINDNIKLGFGYSVVMLITGLQRNPIHSVRINLSVNAGKYGSFSSSVFLNSGKTYNMESRASKTLDYRFQLNYSNSF
jgi:hypothetical protein